MRILLIKKLFVRKGRMKIRRKIMLDIRFVRENPEVVKQNIRNKFQDAKLH